MEMIQSTSNSWKGPKIIQNKEKPSDFVEREYKYAAKDSKYVERISALKTHIFFPTRGDGNCFSNAVAAGVLLTTSPEELLNKLNNYLNNNFSYITDDTSLTGPEYAKSIIKDDDFSKVIRFLLETENKNELIKEDDFMCRISRIIRYILCIEGTTDVYIDAPLLESGQDIDLFHVLTINKIFGEKVVGLVLRSGSAEFDPKDPKKIYKIEGTEGPFSESTKSEEISIDEIPSRDFYILRHGAHFLLSILDKEKAAIKIQQAFKKFVGDKPEIPECYEGKTTHYKYPISIPEKSDKFVFVGNRNNMAANCYRIGAKIDKYAEELGNTTMSVFSNRNPKIFQADDHNINLPDLSSCSDEALKGKLRALGLSEEGNRVDLFKRLVDAKEAENQELIPERLEHDQATRRINKTALLLILGLMITAAATKRRYGTLSPKGIWKQMRQAPQAIKQKV
jgi:hypothetical protein